jgi:hypothetical protein
MAELNSGVVQFGLRGLKPAFFEARKATAGSGYGKRRLFECFVSAILLLSSLLFTLLPDLACRSAV